MANQVVRVAIAQMELFQGQPKRNLESAIAFLDQARALNAQLVVFPAFCIGGFPPARFGQSQAYKREVRELEEELAASSSEEAIAFATMPDSPTHGILSPFQEFPLELRAAQNGAWLASQADGLIHIELGASTFSLSGDNALCARYANMGADIHIAFRTTPWTVDSDEHAPCGASPVQILVSPTGIQDWGQGFFLFDGRSAISLRAGDSPETLESKDVFEPELSVAEIDFEACSLKAISGFSGSTYKDQDDKILDALCFGIRSFDEQVLGARGKWIIGLSGGLDSSITAALLSLALTDKGRIRGYNLATRYNSNQTKDNAHMLASALGISIADGSIEPLVDATKQVAKDYGYAEGQLEGLVEENIQARIRGHLLSSFAAIEGGVVVNNGNKVECALGYATLYGDAIGALAPIADLTKERLFGLSRAINRRAGFEAIPENLLPELTAEGYVWQTMPSAELKDAQTDPMKWFYHDWLIEELLANQGDPEGVMESYLNGSLQNGELGRWIEFYGLDNPQDFIDDLEWVLGQISRAAFKRKQSPPGITLTKQAFGFGFRECQLAYERGGAYRALRSMILAKRP